MTASASEDNIVMVWQPTMRIWAGDEVKIDEKELESDAMEGVESTGAGGSRPKTDSRMSISAASVSGDD
jgi:histone-binding protein RBBP4